MKIEIIDLGINNINSISRAISKSKPTQSECRVISDSNESQNADMYVLPGLGHFATGIRQLTNTGLDKLLLKAAEESKIILGVCLGMQLLFESSEESPGVAGLGLLEGNVKRLSSEAKVPNIGWDQINIQKENLSFPSLSANKDFYFVHSFHCEVADESQILTRTPFGSGSFISSVSNSKILAFQFHPEKSGKIGQQLFTEIFLWAKEL